MKLNKKDSILGGLEVDFNTTFIFQNTPDQGKNNNNMPNR